VDVTVSVAVQGLQAGATDEEAILGAGERTNNQDGRGHGSICWREVWSVTI